MTIYYSNSLGKETYAAGIGDSICDCCGTRIADPDNGTTNDYVWDDELDDEVRREVPIGFLEGRQGIFIQEGQIGEVGTTSEYRVDHIETKNGWISVKVEHVW